MREPRIGTSGWSYPHWEGVFYPPCLPQKKWLLYYSQFFDTVEINSSFYHLPRATTFSKWKESTPSGFIFSVKASRYITHIKKMKEVEEPLNRFYEVARELGDRLGPLLFQFPPQLKFNREIFSSFVELLSSDFRYVFEFRNESFFAGEVYEILKEKDICLCFSDTPSFPYQEVVTSSFIYLRLHGHGSLYTDFYSEEELKEWGAKIRFWLGERDVYCYFDNDYEGFAVKNAQRLKEILS